MIHCEEELTDQTMVNMSLGGALITYPEHLALGQALRLTFRVPHLEEPIVVDAVVRWSTNDSIGVQFDGLRAREVWSLNKLFEQFKE